jgi:hypothetical protein
MDNTQQMWNIQKEIRANQPAIIALGDGWSLLLHPVGWH